MDSHIFLRAASDNADYSIDNGLMHVIWAMGQETGMYKHIPQSGLEKGTPSVKDFYRSDEIKYHGKENRGTVALDFYGERK